MIARLLLGLSSRTSCVQRNAAFRLPALRLQSSASSLTSSAISRRLVPAIAPMQFSTSAAGKALTGNSDPLVCLSPLDGRYGSQTGELRNYFSEFALIKYRLLVELRWLAFMAAHDGIPEVAAISAESQQFLKQIATDFSVKDGLAVKAIEKTTNHDVKAVEYFLKDAVKDNSELNRIKEFFHFSCTSEDISNLSYGLMIKDARDHVLIPLMSELIDTLTALAKDSANQPMLSRTHGQSATPTTMGKEVANFAYRLARQREQLQAVSLLGKFNGAVGNYNAHMVAYPELNWDQIGESFVTSLGLAHNPYSTQIEPHDCLAELFEAVTRFNTVLLDLDKDFWAYISLGYFRTKTVAGEVGSSTMPHKVNPIDFENSEGNLGLANSLFTHFSQKLPISRWQRDLTDSTVLRNVGVAFGHSVLAYKSALKGLRKLQLDRNRINDDLNNSWEVLAEPIQTVMRRYGHSNPYEQLKAITRGNKIDKETIQKFVSELNLPADVKSRLMSLTPLSYIGNADVRAVQVGDAIKQLK